MKCQTFFLPLAALLLSCATPRGFDRGMLARDLANRAVTSDEDMRSILDRNPQLPRPFRLGICFRQPMQADSNAGFIVWDWQPGDKQILLDVGERLKQKGVVSEVIPIAPAFGGGESLGSIRQAAAQHEVDGVLIVGGIADLDRYNNRWGPSYAALVTMLFVPGTVVESVFVTHAALWDVREGFQYLTAEADGEAKMEHPVASIQEDKVVDGAKKASLEALAREVEWRIARLAEGRGN
jgi:hypothetical protein